MKKLNLSFYVILIVIVAFCTTNCGKDSNSGGGGVAVLLGDLIGFWQNNSDSFTFQDQGGQLGGSGTINNRSGTVTNSKINNTSFTFDLIFDDDKTVKGYQGTIDATKKILKLTSGTTNTFTKQ
ncbi:hypothetical protein [Mucilaginibacter sp. OK098]|uniref:hypothetical protein n=1 Tax=Mucilaginibacter sp. OK098 TaxID=1855297 RepID=UPI000919817C|nr:hypothetical protein [Mucilaginibacter sp. OK098]SHM98190.1 hypothetical protein SAMN05216524_104403 [Mucilaginibacter sp. OK098]